MHDIQKILSSTIHSLFGENFVPEISVAPKPELGEYCINVFPLAGKLKQSPQSISEKIATKLRENTAIFRESSATGGYVNFFFHDAIWIDIFSDLCNPSSQKLKNSTIVVDYIGANVGKPLHIGHICTPSIGQVVCNIYSHLGYNVIGDSHFGDWGGIFGKLITSWKIRKGGKSPPENVEDRLEKEGIEYLVELYQWFHTVHEDAESRESLDNQAREEFKKLSGGDKENIELWKKFTSVSITETEKKLKLLNVEANYNIGESFYEGLSLPRPNEENYPPLTYTMKNIVKELIIKGIATQNDDGSVGVVFPEESKLPSCILQKKDGTGLYLTSDLAAIKYRLTNGWNPSKIIYCIDVRQQLHLRQAFWIAKQAWGEELGANEVELYHAFNGFIKLKEGAMSTRNGTVIFLEALIDEGFERTKKILKEKGRELASEDIQKIAIAAIKYSYLSQDREKDVVFDWDKALSFEGNSGPYIQYAYVRAKKMIAEEIKETYPLEGAVKEIQLAPYDKSLIQTLARFDEIVQTVAKTYKPHHLALYAYDLAVAFNSFYVHTPKVREEKDTRLKDFRIQLVEKTSEKLALTFNLLGIHMPSEM